MSSDMKSKYNSKFNEKIYESERTATFDTVNFHPTAPDTDVGYAFSTFGEEGQGLRESRKKVELETIYENDNFEDLPKTFSQVVD